MWLIQNTFGHVPYIKLMFCVWQVHTHPFVHWPVVYIFTATIIHYKNAFSSCNTWIYLACSKNRFVPVIKSSLRFTHAVQWWAVLHVAHEIEGYLWIETILPATCGRFPPFHCSTKQLTPAQLVYILRTPNNSSV